MKQWYSVNGNFAADTSHCAKAVLSFKILKKTNYYFIACFLNCGSDVLTILFYGVICNGVKHLALAE